MTISDSLIWWMTERLSPTDWSWIEFLLGSYVFAMTGWQRKFYWLYKDDGTLTKRVAQTAGVVKASVAMFVVFDSFTTVDKPKPFAMLFLFAIALDQTASFFAQRRIDEARAVGKITGVI